VQRPTKKSVEREDDIPKNDPVLAGWIGKETSLAVKAGPVVLGAHENHLPPIDQPPNDSVSVSVASVSTCDPEEDDGETRELS
jgi:hypothetical protein